jgi:hypothetical protein
LLDDNTIIPFHGIWLGDANHRSGAALSSMGALQKRHIGPWQRRQPIAGE